MGRTNPTYRDRLRSLEGRWSDYRHTLRRRDRKPFDRLWEYARAHADAGGFQNPPDPMDAVFLSICLEQERRIETLEERMEAREARIVALEERIETFEAQLVEFDGADATEVAKADPAGPPETGATE